LFYPCLSNVKRRQMIVVIMNRITAIVFQSLVILVIFSIIYIYLYIYDYREFFSSSNDQSRYAQMQLLRNKIIFAHNAINWWIKQLAHGYMRSVLHSCTIWINALNAISWSETNINCFPFSSDLIDYNFSIYNRNIIFKL